MMDEKTYNKMVAANLRRIMYERGVTQTDMEKDISDLTKYDSDMTQKKPVNKGFFENFLYLRASFISAGSGGRTRTQSAYFLTESVSVPNHVPIPIKKKSGASAPPSMKNVCMQ